MTKGIYVGGSAIGSLRIGSLVINSVYVGGTKIWPTTVPLSASVSPTTVSGYISSAGTGNVQSSQNAIASGSGGTGTYTYLWQYVSGDVFNITSSTSAGTKFSKSIAAGTSYTGIYRCKVSDGVSIAYTPNVTVTLSNTGVT